MHIWVVRARVCTEKASEINQQSFSKKGAWATLVHGTGTTPHLVKLALQFQLAGNLLERRLRRQGMGMGMGGVNSRTNAHPLSKAWAAQTHTWCCSKFCSSMLAAVPVLCLDAIDGCRLQVTQPARKGHYHALFANVMQGLGSGFEDKTSDCRAPTRNGNGQEQMSDSPGSRSNTRTHHRSPASPMAGVSKATTPSSG
jgi:hypothetical protein